MPFFWKKPELLILMIHGFGMRTSSEFDELYAYLERKKYAVRRFDIYDPHDPEDADPETWISRCVEQMHSALEENKNVVVLGFSMGGVIATYLASIFKLKGLILVAPAFRYMDLSKVEKAVSAYIGSLYTKAEKEVKEKPSSDQTRAFMQLVDKYRDRVSQITCPVLILHGTDDEVINVRSSRDAFAKIPTEHKRLVLVEGAHHRMLYDGQQQDVPFALINDFLQGEIARTPLGK